MASRQAEEQSMESDATRPVEVSRKRGVSPAKVAIIVLITVLVTLAGSYWFLRTFVFARDFTPVELSAREDLALDGKLRALGFQPDGSRADPGQPSPDEFDAQGALKPEAYSEVGAKREVGFNERELNALLARNTDLASKLAIDLSRDLVSVKMLLPMEPDFPVLGGKTLRVNAGVEVAYLDGKPSVILKGVSLMGVPVPNAWLGGLKNVDLVAQFGGSPGFWRSFAEGVEDIRVEDGQVKVKLKE
jgi:hypothetical protein